MEDPEEAAAAEDAARHLRISRELGIEIIDGAWPVDQTRRLEDIQARFGVSRTVAREAARRLESLGMVRSRRGRGLEARPIADWKVMDPDLIDWRLHSTRRREQIYSLTQLRLAVEPAAAERMARHAPIRTRAKLLPLAAEMRRAGEAGELQEFMEYDIEFHRLLLEASENELFAALSPLVAVVLRGRTELGLMPKTPRPEALAGHEAVAEAIFKGDPSGARIAMQFIIDEVRQAFSDAEPPTG